MTGSPRNCFSPRARRRLAAVDRRGFITTTLATGFAAAVRPAGAHRDRLAITGFCWGGRITWLYAAHSPEVDCGIAGYGRLVGAPSALQPLQPVDVAAKLHAPVPGLYAGRDGGIPLDSEIVVYPEAQHGFYADYRPEPRAILFDHSSRTSAHAVAPR